MIHIEQIRNFFPAQIRDNPAFDKYMLKEYLLLLILHHIASTPYSSKMIFIGGTNLRLIKGIDRFSEDLDFDWLGQQSKDDFTAMATGVVRYLERNGFRIVAKEKNSPKAMALCYSIYFPELLFELNLTGHREERFLIKIEAQHQGVTYEPVTTNIRGCGFFFPLLVPPDSVLCAMKVAAMLARAKGRDFYDVMFLLSQTQPNYDFLRQRCGIDSLKSFKKATATLLQSVDLTHKQKDFEHLLFNRENSEKILRFGAFIDGL
jgi:predicted nucleotidyltransferase component of viral defense system